MDNFKKEGSNDLLNKIIYTVGALIIVLDINGRITKFNRKCEEITGFKEEEIVGRSIWDFLKPNPVLTEYQEKANDVLEILLNSILSSSFESEIITAIIALQHHERYYGNGYPQGLKGKDIDISAKITSIADVFDALSTNRIYKKAYNKEEIIDFFYKEKGKYFDPELTEIFLNNFEIFWQIKSKIN